MLELTFLMYTEGGKYNYFHLIMMETCCFTFTTKYLYKNADFNNQVINVDLQNDKMKNL